MKDYTDAELAKLLDNKLFRLLSETADSLGVECYVVGGYVRDIFLERPSDDIDVVVVGSGIEMAEAFKKKLGSRARLSVFRSYGTAQVKFKNTEVEFVGARKESYHRESRNPIVENGTLEDDQNRRDFTINAMAICLNHDRFGELVDPFGSDDPLRMLRCVRFATRFKFYIDEETFDALGRNAERIKIVSAERIAVELNKIMMTETPSTGFDYLHRSGLLAIILPEIAALDVVETRNGRAHKNNFYHTLEVLDNVAKKSDNLWLRWAALLHDVGKPKSKRWDPVAGWTFHNHNLIGAKMVPAIFRRLKQPLDYQMKYVQNMVELHMRPIVIADAEVTDSAVRRLLNDAQDDIDDLLLLCEADITSKNQVRKQRFHDNYRLVREKIEELKKKDYKRLFQPCIDGNEIMQIFGLKPSPEVGTLKTCIKDAVLDGKVPNEREALLALLMEKGNQLGLKPVGGELLS